MDDDIKEMWKTYFENGKHSESFGGEDHGSFGEIENTSYIIE